MENALSFITRNMSDIVKTLRALSITDNEMEIDNENVMEEESMDLDKPIEPIIDTDNHLTYFALDMVHTVKIKYHDPNDYTMKG